MKLQGLLLIALTLLNCSEPGETGAVPLPSPVEPGTAFVLSTALTYTTSSLATFSIERPSEVSDDLLLASGDAVLVKLGEWLGVLNRGLDSNLHLIGHRGEVGPQFVLPGCGPHDALLLPDGRVALACFESPDLAFLSLETGAIETLSLLPFADGDGLPELDHLALVGDVLYVTAQRLNRNAGFAATLPGLLIAVDIPSQTVLDLAVEDPTREALELPCHNPYTHLVTTSEGSLLLGCVANFQDPAGGGLLEIFPSTGQVSTLATVETLGGYPTALRLSPDGALWVQIYTPSPEDPYTTVEMAIVPLTPSPGERGITRAGFTLGGFDFDPRGTLYYALRDLDAPGVYQIPGDGGEEPPPLVLGLPPLDFAFF